MGLCSSDPSLSRLKEADVWRPLPGMRARAEGSNKKHAQPNHFCAADAYKDAFDDKDALMWLVLISLLLIWAKVPTLKANRVELLETTERLTAIPRVCFKLHLFFVCETC